MSSLAGLVEKGRVAPDWAEALAPVDEQIAAMGRFLREESRPGGATSPPPTGSSGRSSARSPTYACWWWGRTPIPTRSTRSG